MDEKKSYSYSKETKDIKEVSQEVSKEMPKADLNFNASSKQAKVEKQEHIEIKENKEVKKSEDIKKVEKIEKVENKPVAPFKPNLTKKGKVILLTETRAVVEVEGKGAIRVPNKNYKLGDIVTV